jgi:hypothetical protein
MKLLVCGGRDFFDAERVDRILDIWGPTFIIHGGARGADALAANWAAKRGVPTRCFPADWHTHGKSAGIKRNRQMLIEGRPDWVLAFPGGAGTANMCAQATQHGVPVVQVGQRRRRP